MSNDPSLNPKAARAVFEKIRPEVDKITKGRFFYRQGSEIYGGAAGFWAYGPPGCSMKNKMFDLWRNHFVTSDKLMEIEDTIIMQHEVLKASGHVDLFEDFLVKDSKDENRFWRIDKLLEEIFEKRIADAETDELKKEYADVMINAGTYDKQQLMDCIEKYKIKAPETGNDLTEPVAINLMFPTPIGPLGKEQGYLRPETAQGMFLNFKFCAEQNSQRMPFGISQIGKVFRNELAPRGGITRCREFSQMEIEWFIKPGEYAHPKYKKVADVELTLWSAAAQESGEAPKKMTLREAVDNKIIKDNNETIAYYIGMQFLFFMKMGIRADMLRFRQHMKNEMAHYASDCWDPEAMTSYGWLEIGGLANRSAFDLTAHSKASKTDLKIRQTLKEPITQMKCVLAKASAAELMKHFKKEGKAVKEALEALEYEELRDLQAKCDANPDGTVKFNIYEIPSKLLKTDSKEEKVSTIAFIPGVIEPTFGVDRILFTAFEHTFTYRPASADGEARAYLRLPHVIAPYGYTILPLMSNLTKHENYAPLVEKLEEEFANLKVTGNIDDSGVSIGRRYARNDELGVPFAITIDHDALEKSMVTLRERDSVKQVRIHVDEVPSVVEHLLNGRKTWEVCLSQYEEVQNEAAAAIGNK